MSPRFYDPTIWIEYEFFFPMIYNLGICSVGTLKSKISFPVDHTNKQQNYIIKKKLNFLKILSFWNLMKILNFFEIFEILNFKTKFYFFILEFWKSVNIDCYILHDYFPLKLIVKYLLLYNKVYYYTLCKFLTLSIHYAKILQYQISQLTRSIIIYFMSICMEILHIHWFTRMWHFSM
jgi:hypothetical protein